MSEIIQHTINYTIDELKEIGSTKGVVFRKYTENSRFDLSKEDFSSNIEVSNLGHIKINGNIVSPFEKEFEKGKGCFYVKLQGTGGEGPGIDA
jgi:hypothetical protein